ncbi:unnamed protein product [Protopolystoma xenopodis]|uniref:RanBP2-type domain-containing protein n=1 Tax=Protopolystoma xenopodis TaxID=117903 RepID=A0A3S5CE99_9PLAT|nr:unnamed protein product [Protopolystoma xenopodis]
MTSRSYSSHALGPEPADGLVPPTLSFSNLSTTPPTPLTRLPLAGSEFSTSHHGNSSSRLPGDPGAQSGVAVSSGLHAGQSPSSPPSLCVQASLPSAQVADKSDDETPWHCAKCTYHNCGLLPRCEMCDTVRPPSANRPATLVATATAAAAAASTISSSNRMAELLVSPLVGRLDIGVNASSQPAQVVLGDPQANA